MAKVIMIQGTMSNAGKSLITAGLCRVFAQDGYRVAPFKSQNMALNSYVTDDGLEMGRAQVMQAEAAGIAPCAEMNPILLKPTSDVGSQVVVMGKVRCNMGAAEYYQYKKELIPEIKEAFRKLSEKADIIVVEGAGSPAEINLKENDIVNMGLAKMLGAPVLLAGDIDRGGVFAQLLGCLMLMDEDEKDLVKGLIINKFRGDKTLLEPGVKILEEKCGVPVTAVLPYIRLQVDDEDSLSDRLENRMCGGGPVSICVVRLPHLSNYTDFNVFEETGAASVRYVSKARELTGADLVILPGSKNTIADLRWLHESGMGEAVKQYAAAGGPVIGICGGYQMLGRLIRDPYHTEEGGEMEGLGLLPTVTVLLEEKTTTRTEGVFAGNAELLAGLSGKAFAGYEIHMGETLAEEEVQIWCRSGAGETQAEKTAVTDGMPVGSAETEGLSGGNAEMAKNHETAKAGEVLPAGVCCGNVYGSYIHGIFDARGIAAEIVQALARKKGVEIGEIDEIDHEAFKQSQYDILADMIRENMDMEAIYGMLREATV
ncbi:MAG: cobyric acid synthase [Lachnospiraceae bacterium]|nr:cobyric acid synthase [Lachnospiraceae bacterium]